MIEINQRLQSVFCVCITQLCHKRKALKLKNYFLFIKNMVSNLCSANFLKVLPFGKTMKPIDV